MKLLLPFDTDEPQFVRGFEMGRVWALLNALLSDEDLEPDKWADEGEMPWTLHAGNEEMILRIADSLGLRARAMYLGETGWIEVWFWPKEEAA